MTAPAMSARTARTARAVRAGIEVAGAELAVAVLIWVALPAGLGVIRVLRSEVKSS